MARRDSTVAAPVLLGAICALAGCGDRKGYAPQALAVNTVAQLNAAPSFGARVPWTSATGVAVEAAIDPRRITLPHAEIGGHLGGRTGMVALEFAGKSGQVLEIRLEQQGADEPRLTGEAAAPSTAGGLAVLATAAPGTSPAAELRVLIVDHGLAAPRYAELAAPAVGASELFVRLPADAQYVVQLRPPDGLYRLALELLAPLPFPVPGYDYTAIGSYFGASRESGRRRHEGVDIFVPRRTPVVAVANGLVSLHAQGRGGIAVVLSIAGISYYYAHLERTAVGEGQRVRIGDVLGYVGSTGNARGSAPHLHFGVYEFGKGAVDPLPLLEERRFTNVDDEPLTAATAVLVAEDQAPIERKAAAVTSTGGGSADGEFAVTALAVIGGCGLGAAFLPETHVGAASIVTMAGEWRFGGGRSFDC